MAAIEAPAYVPSPTAARPASIEPPPPLPASAQTAHALPAGVSPLAPSPEIHALDRAIALLRRDHDAGAALAALDTYLDRYPHGVLQREARLARLDALLVLKRTDEALAVLETLPLDNRRRSTEHQVMRAELRARTDCSRAEEDFNVALTHSPDAALLERILYGRGACRAKMGKASGAAEDLQHYLERFPSGAHATWARQWLDTINRPPLKGG
jgi:TolA-binding protein